VINSEIQAFYNKKIQDLQFNRNDVEDTDDEDELEVLDKLVNPANTGKDKASNDKILEGEKDKKLNLKNNTHVVQLNKKVENNDNYNQDKEKPINSTDKVNNNTNTNNNSNKFDQGKKSDENKIISNNNILINSTKSNTYSNTNREIKDVKDTKESIVNNDTEMSIKNRDRAFSERDLISEPSNKMNKESKETRDNIDSEIYEKQYFSLKDQFVDTENIDNMDKKENEIQEEEKENNSENPNNTTELNKPKENYIIKSLKYKPAHELQANKFRSNSSSNNNNNENFVEGLDGQIIIQQQPNRITFIVFFTIEIIYTFLFSMIPSWSDEFEDKNPVIVNNNAEANNNNQVNQENVDNNAQINEENNDRHNQIINNLREDVNNNMIKNLNNHENNLNDYNKYDEDHDPIIIDEKNIDAVNKLSLNTDTDVDDNTDNQLSELKINRDSNSKLEKVVLKSSNDTRRVNNDVESKRFNFVGDDIRTEGEIVFSENAYIDNISYNNESVVEAFKIKNENDLKENDKETLREEGKDFKTKEKME
jgi:hypothetical protein